MPCVKFTSHLQRFFPGLQNGLTVEGETVAEVITSLDERFNGFADYIVDERGRLRKHVNIFIGEDLIYDREQLQDRVSDDSQIFIMQALSGG